MYIESEREREREREGGTEGGGRKIDISYSHNLTNIRLNDFKFLQEN